MNSSQNESSLLSFLHWTLSSSQTRQRLIHLWFPSGCHHIWQGFLHTKQVSYNLFCNYCCLFHFGVQSSPSPNYLPSLIRPLTLVKLEPEAWAPAGGHTFESQHHNLPIAPTFEPGFGSVECCPSLPLLPPALHQRGGYMSQEQHMAEHFFTDQSGSRAYRESLPRT